MKPLLNKSADRNNCVLHSTIYRFEWSAGLGLPLGLEALVMTTSGVVSFSFLGVQVSLVMSAEHSGRSVVPQQRMLRFSRAAGKAAAYFNLKPSKLKEQTYTITVTSSSLEKQTGGQVSSDGCMGFAGLLQHTSASASGRRAERTFYLMRWRLCLAHMCGAHSAFVWYVQRSAALCFCFSREHKHKSHVIRAAIFGGYALGVLPPRHNVCCGQDGAYSLDLLIGDNALDVPVIWRIGTVAASFQSSENSQTGLAAVNALFKAKPEIVHLQRVPGRRPASVVSILFTALALAPLLLLYVMLQSVGANLKVL